MLRIAIMTHDAKRLEAFTIPYNIPDSSPTCCYQCFPTRQLIQFFWRKFPCLVA
uniref:Uncharacterized protein n=1 Tax=Arundo donax TaxID=35708 RepID=A0A0A9F2W3_ARUDO